MYQNIYCDGETNTIHIWDDVRGHIKKKHLPVAYIPDPNGEYTSLYGEKLTRVQGWRNDEAKYLVQTDVPTEIDVLMQEYPDSDDVSINHRTLMFDIEVSKGEDGYSEAVDATEPLTAISWYDTKVKQYFGVVYDLQERLQIGKYNGSDYTLFVVKNEEQLLRLFVTYWQKLVPTIVTGWNSELYDIPYFINRLMRYDTSLVEALSPIGKVDSKYINDGLQQTYTIAGVSCLDMLVLYKKFTFGEKGSYKLHDIALAEVGEGKVEYDGELTHLFASDFDKFVAYFIQDTRLLVKLNDKLDHIGLAQATAHKGRIPYEQVIFPSSYLEGASLVYLAQQKEVAGNKPKKSKYVIKNKIPAGSNEIHLKRALQPNCLSTGFLSVAVSKTSKFLIDFSHLSDDRKSIYLNKPLERDLLEEYEISPKLPGAYVKEPIPGFYEWMFDLDLQSLYPSIIMTVNISPETKMFRILNWDADDLLNRVSKQFKVSVNGTVKTMNSDVMYAALIKNKYAIAANGVVYRTDVKGFIPTILERWFNERVEFKNLMKQYKKSGNEELVRFYNTRQMVMKVMLNSFYGVLALPTFRFYDVENAEAVTSTGQTIIKKTEVFANAYYESVIGQPGRYVKYVDTDSQFISSVPLVQHRFPDWETRGRQWMIEQTIGVADEVQKYINTCYSAYCVDYHNVTEHKLYIKQENVAIAGIWLAKKRYAQRVINEEGINVDKLDVKGMDIIRSDYPKAFKTILSDVINMILDKRTNEDINNFILDFKEKLRILPLNDIMFPTGVKGIEDYESKQLFACKKGTPAHVRSCINYNSLIKQLGIKGFGPIQSKDKIKWTYIVENTYFINCIALKGFDDPTEVTAFVQKHVDYDKVLETQFTSKIQQFWDALKWEMPSNNKLISTFFSF